MIHLQYSELKFLLLSHLTALYLHCDNEFPQYGPVCSLLFLLFNITLMIIFKSLSNLAIYGSYIAIWIDLPIIKDNIFLLLFVGCLTSCSGYQKLSYILVKSRNECRFSHPVGGFRNLFNSPAGFGFKFYCYFPLCQLEFSE